MTEGVGDGNRIKRGPERIRRMLVKSRVKSMFESDVCDACLTVPMDNVDGEPHHVDCSASNSEHHVLLRAEKKKAQKAERLLEMVQEMLHAHMMAVARVGIKPDHPLASSDLDYKRQMMKDCDRWERELAKLKENYISKALLDDE